VLKQLSEFLQHCWNLMRVMRDEFRCSQDEWAGSYPAICCLCGDLIESRNDLDWHGFGNCARVTDEHWARWEERNLA
jgi:hypothetical protein